MLVCNPSFVCSVHWVLLLFCIYCLFVHLHDDLNVRNRLFHLQLFINFCPFLRAREKPIQCNNQSFLLILFVWIKQIPCIALNGNYAIQLVFSVTLQTNSAPSKYIIDIHKKSIYAFTSTSKSYTFNIKLTQK